MRRQCSRRRGPGQSATIPPPESGWRARAYFAKYAAGNGRLGEGDWWTSVNPRMVCEVADAATGPSAPPAISDKAQRVAAEGEPVLGWRPAVGQVVPNTKWVLEQKLGEGGFGEVWLGRHQTMKERRVFKFCFRADRVRSLKREMTLFRLIKERIGDHLNILALREVYFDAPPFAEIDAAEEAKAR
jgi:hypothetical protein